MADLRLCGERVGPGELETGEYLAAHLPDSWRILCNIRVWNYGGTSNEVDFLVIGDYGLYVIDEKHLAGEVTIGTHRWLLEGTEPIPNPVDKTERVSAIVAAQVRELLPGLAAGVGGGFFVFGYVALSRAPSRLIIEDEAVAKKVYQLQEAPGRLVSLDSELKSRQAADSATVSPFAEQLTEKHCPRVIVTPHPIDDDPDASSAAGGASSSSTPTETGGRHWPRILTWIPVACLVALAVAFAWFYAASQPVRWDEARGQVRKTATVYGPVVQSTKKPKWGDLTHINVGSDFRPGLATPFYLRIDPEYRGSIEAELRQFTGNSPSP